MTQLEKNQNYFEGRNSDKGNLFFNLLFFASHYIFTLFSVVSTDGNVLFWTSTILLRFLNKEISKMLITKIYQIFFSIIQRRCSCSKEVRYILLSLPQHGVGKMSNSSLSPSYLFIAAVLSLKPQICEERVDHTKYTILTEKLVCSLNREAGIHLMISIISES